MGRDGLSVVTKQDILDLSQTIDRNINQLGESIL